MKNTPLQQLIEFMEQNQYFIGNDLYAKQKELLQKEKEVIVDAFNHGCFGEIGKFNGDSEKYFNEIFEQ